MEMSYEKLEQVNKEIRTTPIKGKEYAEVNERIKAFRKIFPQGWIKTLMLNNENGICVFEAKVGFYSDSNEPLCLGVGHAYEKENQGMVNKTSYIENCETSAVGRALGMVGIGIDTSVASFEEVDNAIKQQQKIPNDLPKEEQNKLLSNITKEEAKTLIQFAQKIGWGNTQKEASARLLEDFGVERLTQITKADYATFVKEHGTDK